MEDNTSHTPAPDSNALQRKTCEFVEASDLVPTEWTPWLWSRISEDAPFSWGDNNRSMVCACDFRRHCEDRLLDASDEEDVPQEDIDQFLERLRELGDLYIDLEN